MSTVSNRSGFDVENIHETNRRAPQNSESMIWILKYWVKRARFVRLIRSQIAGLLEKMTNKYCNFCGINWGLKGETIESIEEIFHCFWKELMENEKKQRDHKEKEGKNRVIFGRSYYSNSIREYETRDIINWQQYFEKHATIRTICFECMNEVFEQKKRSSCLNDYNIYNKVILENVVKEEEEKTKTEKVKKIKKMLKENQKIKEILKLWKLLAKKKRKKS